MGVGGRSGNDIRGLCWGKGGLCPAGAVVSREAAGGPLRSLEPGARPGPLPGGVSCPVRPPWPLPAPSPGRSLYGLGAALSPPPPSLPWRVVPPRLARGCPGPGRRVRGLGAEAVAGEAALTLLPAVRRREQLGRPGKGTQGGAGGVTKRSLDQGVSAWHRAA